MRLTPERPRCAAPDPYEPCVCGGPSSGPNGGDTAPPRPPRPHGLPAGGSGSPLHSAPAAAVDSAGGGGGGGGGGGSTMLVLRRGEGWAAEAEGTARGGGGHSAGGAAAGAAMRASCSVSLVRPTR